MKQKVFESEVLGPIRQNHSRLLRNIRPGRDGTTCHKRKYEPQPPSPLKLMLMLFSGTKVPGNYWTKKSKTLKHTQ